MHSSVALERKLGFDSQSSGHFEWVVRLHLAVEFHAVSGDRASEHGGVGGEHRCCLRDVFVEVQQAKAGHPFMKMSRNAIIGGHIILIKMLNHLCGRVSKHGRLNVIPASLQRVKVVAFPVFGENLVFLGEILCKVNEDDHRLSGNLPATYADIQPIFLCFGGPFGEEVFIFFKIRIVAGFFPDFRSYHNQIIIEQGF